MPALRMLPLAVAPLPLPAAGLVLVLVPRGSDVTEVGQIAFRYAEEIFAIGAELASTVRGNLPNTASTLVIGIVDSTVYILTTNGAPMGRIVAVDVEDPATRRTIIPESEHVPEIRAQNGRFFRKGAAVLNEVLGQSSYLVGDRFSVTDIYAAYTVNWGQEQGLIDEYSNLLAYQDRLFDREHCTLQRHH